MANSAVKSVMVDQLAIPLRREVAHAASRRSVSQPLVVSVELNSGLVGYGETLPRPYVTGESESSVLQTVERVYCPWLLRARPTCFPEALEFIESLPWRNAFGEQIPAARAAVELALLDAYARHFGRPISDAVGWMGLNEFGAPGSLRRVRHSGVVASSSVKSVRRTLRMLWWYGVRDFKLKVGDDGEEERLKSAVRFLGRAISSGQATLRLDANGGWSLTRAVERLAEWRDLGLAFVEQPLAKGSEAELAELKSCVHQPLMYDESLVTIEDAERLVALQVADGFNIRISKCGGLLPSLRLAHYARKQGVTIQLGCMVGETSILTAAGRKFLELVPGVRFAEGAFGRFLLRDDVVRRSLRFSYGGSVKALSGSGWGISVDPKRLSALRTDGARLIL